MQIDNGKYIYFDKEDAQLWDVDLGINGSGRWLTNLYSEDGQSLNVTFVDKDPLHLAQTLEFIAQRVRADYRNHLARGHESA
jgi:hypothetical protein